MQKNGLVGGKAAGREDVDHILVDINLSDIDGYQIAHRLRTSSRAALARIPIIAITAIALKGDAEKALSTGRDVHMS